MLSLVTPKVRSGHSPSGLKRDNPIRIKFSYSYALRPESG